MILLKKIKDILTMNKKETTTVSQVSVAKYVRDGDGIKPGTTPWGATVRMPLDINVLPHSISSVDLGLKFNRPALVYTKGSLKVMENLGKIRAHINTDAGDLLYGDKTLVLTIENLSDSMVTLDEREAVIDVVFTPIVELMEG